MNQEGCGSAGRFLEQCLGQAGGPGKTAWPELVGSNGDEAVRIIMKENPKIESCFTLPSGVLTTCEINCWRVRVWVDKVGGYVIQVPMIG